MLALPFVLISAAIGCWAAICRLVGSYRGLLAIILIGSACYEYLTLDFFDLEVVQVSWAALVVAANFGIGFALWRARLSARWRTLLYCCGVIGSVVALFILHETGTRWTLILLINQIIFLSQVRAKTAAVRPVEWAAFNMLFPRNVAGPVIGYSSFTRRLHSASNRARTAGLAETGTIFIAVGLAKIALIANGLELSIRPVFDAAERGAVVGGTDAAFAAVANYLQLYFGLSGACEIGAGVLLLLGMHVPVSFASPMRATSIASFWRRYHRTIVAFVRVYLYRAMRYDGRVARAVAAAASFILIGIWLTPSIPGVCWGLAQAAALGVDIAIKKTRKHATRRSLRISGWIVVHSFMAVTAVLLRLSSVAAVGAFLKGLAGRNGFALPAASVAFFSNFNEFFEEHHRLRALRRSLNFTDNPLLANHTLGLISLVILLAVAVAVSAIGPALGDASRLWRRAYFIVVVYFVLGLIAQRTAFDPLFHGIRF